MQPKSKNPDLGSEKLYSFNLQSGGKAALQINAAIKGFGVR
jgi:hypothetical protein